MSGLIGVDISDRGVCMWWWGPLKWWLLSKYLKPVKDVARRMWRRGIPGREQVQSLLV